MQYSKSRFKPVCCFAHGQGLYLRAFRYGGKSIARSTGFNAGSSEIRQDGEACQLRAFLRRSPSVSTMVKHICRSDAYFLEARKRQRYQRRYCLGIFTVSAGNQPPCKKEHRAGRRGSGTGREYQSCFSRSRVRDGRVLRDGW